MRADRSEVSRFGSGCPYPREDADRDGERHDRVERPHAKRQRLHQYMSWHSLQACQYGSILLSNMKATIDIADSLLRQVRQLAAERNTTLRAIVEAALRDALAKQGRRCGPWVAFASAILA